MTNKIGWCDLTFNPVWGCRNHCEYCYARGIAKRFAEVMAENEYYSHYWGNKRCAKGVNRAYIKRLGNDLRNFIPTFLYGQYFKKFPKKPQRIFVGSMSEIYYWKPEWIEMVIEKVRQYPQHTFIFLTKHQEFYSNWIWPKNCWLGLTITKETDWAKSKKMWVYFFSKNNQAWITGEKLKTFLNFEPLLGYISTEWLKISNIDWVIIGAETGNRKDKVIPKLEWVLEIVRYCEHHKIPVYIKDNLVRYYWKCTGYKQFPKVELI